MLLAVFVRPGAISEQFTDAWRISVTRRYGPV